MVVVGKLNFRDKNGKVLREGDKVSKRGEAM
jgi:hypothetical protein